MTTAIASIVVRQSMLRIRRHLPVDKRTEDSLIYAGLHASQCRIQRSRDAFPLQIHRVLWRMTLYGSLYEIIETTILQQSWFVSKAKHPVNGSISESESNQIPRPGSDKTQCFNSR